MLLEVALFEAFALLLPQILQAELVGITQLLWKLQAKVCSDLCELLAGSRVIVDHFLRELLHLWINYIIEGQLGRGDLEHVAARCSIGEQHVSRHLTLLASLCRLLLSGLCRLLRLWLSGFRLRWLFLPWLCGLLPWLCRLFLPWLCRLLLCWFLRRLSWLFLAGRWLLRRLILRQRPKGQ